jgi:hypothetical protein
MIVDVCLCHRLDHGKEARMRYGNEPCCPIGCC